MVTPAFCNVYKQQYKRRISRAIAFFTAIVFLLGGSCPSYAENGGIEVSQTRVTFRADRDGGLKVPVRIGNTSDEEMAVSVGKTDFEIDSNGVFQVREPGSAANSAFDYIVCEESEFRMPAKSGRILEISLAPGKTYALPEYNSAILVKYAPVSMVESEAQIKTYVQAVIILTVDPGSLVKVDFDTSAPPVSLDRTSFSRIMNWGGKKTLAFYFKNAGVVTVVPNLTTTVSGWISGETTEVPYGITGILPGRIKEYSLRLNPAKRFDIYTVRLKFDYVYGGKSFSAIKEESFAIVSYPVLIGAMLVIAGVIFQIRINRRRKRLLKQLLAEKEALREKEKPEDENKIEDH